MRDPKLITLFILLVALLILFCRFIMVEQNYRNSKRNQHKQNRYGSKYPKQKR